MSEKSEITLIAVQKEFCRFLMYTKGYPKSTCLGYNSDLNVLRRWLDEAGIDWRELTPEQVEQFVAYYMRKGMHPNTVARKISTYATFYKWARRNKHLSHDPICDIDKPKRPIRIPIYMEKEEQALLKSAFEDRSDIKENVFGMSKEFSNGVRDRYEMLFTLIQNSGLRVSEARMLKVSDIRVSDGVAKSVRVVGKGNKERLVPLPSAFGVRLAGFVAKKKKDHYVFEKKEGDQPPHAVTVRKYLEAIVDKAGIEKHITPHKLRHTYATRLIEKDVRLLDVQALLGHSSIATTQLYTHVGQEHLVNVVESL